MDLCHFSVRSGNHGEDAAAWAKMLLSMYEKYFEKQGWAVTEKTIELSSIPEGIEQCCMTVDGDRKKLDCEAGIHRLVRISPYDPEKRRITCFAAVGLDDYQVTDQMIENKYWEDIVRSYFFYPEKRVKDARNGLIEDDIDKVLDGEIEDFITAELIRRERNAKL